MKKRILIFCAVILSISSAHAQLEIMGGATYVFGDKFPIEGGDARINGGANYTGMLNFYLNDYFGIGVMYTLNPSYVEARSIFLQDNYPGRYDARIDVNQHFITIGPIARRNLGNGNSVGGGFLLGVGITENVDRDFNFSSLTRFGMGGHLWFTKMFSDKVGLRLMTSLQVPIENFGAGFSVGTGGVDVGVGGFSEVLQFGLGGGLVIQLGE
jgi:hypothetical protein